MIDAIAARLASSPRCVAREKVNSVWFKFWYDDAKAGVRPAQATRSGGRKRDEKKLKIVRATCLGCRVSLKNCSRVSRPESAGVFRGKVGHARLRQGSRGMYIVQPVRQCVVHSGRHLRYKICEDGYAVQDSEPDATWNSPRKPPKHTFYS